MLARKVALSTLVVVLAAVAAGCGGDDGEAVAAEQPKPPGSECAATIGLITVLAGPVAAVGEEQLSFAQLAIDLFNEQHGTSFELVEGDSRFDPAEAATVAQRFAADEDIVAVVGPLASPEVDAAGPHLTRANLAAVSPSAGNDDLTVEGQYPTFFRVIARNSLQAEAVAGFIANELEADRVTIVDDQASYSASIAEALQERLSGAGIDAVRESVSPDQTDFSALASRVATQSEVVFVGLSNAVSGQVFAEQVREQGGVVTFIGMDPLFSPEEFTFEGAYVLANAPDANEVDEASKMIEAYRERHGDRAFGTFGPTAYAATNAVAEAIRSVCQNQEPTREAVLEAIRELKISESVLGQPISFDENGDLEGARWYIFQIRDGQYEQVK